MLTLYQFEPVWGLPNASPFCMKLKTYLRMAHLDYQVDTSADVRKAHKGKLPYLKDNGKTIADSNLIIDYLKATYGDPLDGHLIERYPHFPAAGEGDAVGEFSRILRSHASNLLCLRVPSLEPNAKAEG